LSDNILSIARKFLQRGSVGKRTFQWVLLSSLLAALLGLASSVYAIQIFNRYIGYGLDGTLITLTVGAIVAVGLEFAIRAVRYRLTSAMLMPEAAREFDGLASTLNQIEFASVIAKPTNYVFEQLKSQQQLNNLYTPANFLAVVDTPFAVLFVLFIFLLSPLLGLLVSLICVICILIGQWHRHRLRDLVQTSNSKQTKLDANLFNSLRLETIRAFNFAPLLASQTQGRLIDYFKARIEIAAEQNQQNSQISLLTALTTIVVIGTGAALVTKGTMDIGSLIGVNILAARAISLLNAAGKLSQSFELAQSLEDKLSEINEEPLERLDGLQIPNYSGRMSIRGLTHGYNPRLGPLFTDLSFEVEPGSVVLICGNNGTGKSTLARILAGVENVQQGQILVDSIDLLQVARSDWHSKVCYVPQEPEFLDLSLRDNLSSITHTHDDDELRQILRRCGCAEMVDHHPEGLDQLLVNAGSKLPPGLRKRLALARAVAADGKIVILDEVHSGLDPMGLKVLMTVLQELMAANKTIFLCSHDRSIIKTGATVIDLNHKPVPDISRV
jgi:ATP-binding cassette subfamily C protein LapB